MPLFFEDTKCHKRLFLDIKRLVLGLSASSKSLYNVLKCKTSEKETFHDIALIISREIYVFVRSEFFSGSRKKVRLPRAHFQHTDIVRYQFSLLLLIFTTVCLNTVAKQL